jgi:hypothetical protein
MQDNQAVMFIVRKWSSRSPLLMSLLRKFWLLLDRHNVRVSSIEYVRSAFNPADRPSRWQYQDEWKLDPQLFRHFDRRFGPHTLDAFASRLTTQVARYLSKFPDPGAIGVDAFSQSWAGECVWVNPRWDDLSRVAHTLRTTPSAAATVVAPYFPGQPWFQELSAMATEMVVLPFRQGWVERPPGPWTYERVGPSSWNVTFFSIRRCQASAGASGSNLGKLQQ